MEELIRELVHLGLTEKEAQVYLAVLELGPAVVQDISHKAKVNRATTYVMIESLVGRGLMSTYIKGKKRYYAPETPERLLSILRLQRQEIESKETELGKALPMLLALFNVEGAKPQIRYLEGLEGVETVRDIFENLQGEFVQIVPLDEVEKIRELMEGRPQHFAELGRRDTPGRILWVTASEDPSVIPSIPNAMNRMVSSVTFPIHGEITVRGNHVFLYSYKSAVLSVIVISKEIADTVRVLFELAWRGVPDLPKK